MRRAASRDTASRKRMSSDSRRRPARERPDSERRMRRIHRLQSEDRTGCGVRSGTGQGADDHRPAIGGRKRVSDFTDVSGAESVPERSFDVTEQGTPAVGPVEIGRQIGERPFVIHPAKHRAIDETSGDVRSTGNISTVAIHAAMNTTDAR